MKGYYQHCLWSYFLDSVFLVPHIHTNTDVPQNRNVSWELGGQLWLSGCRPYHHNISMRVVSLANQLDSSGLWWAILAKMAPHSTLP